MALFIDTEIRKQSRNATNDTFNMTYIEEEESKEAHIWKQGKFSVENHLAINDHLINSTSE